MKHQFIKWIGILLIVTPIVVGSVNAHEGESQLHQWERASPDPDRIFLSFLGDPSVSRAVTWRTDSSVKMGVAQIAIATAGPEFVKSSWEVPAETEQVDLNAHSGNIQGNVHYHSVTFQNLIPDTLYAYRVGDRTHWSEWIQFRTAKSEQEPFSFVYFGDAQNDILEKWSRVIRMSYQKAPEASLAIYAGDLINNGHLDKEWAEWFKAGGWIHAARTGIPVVGNHEQRPIPGQGKGKHLSILWRPQFTLPQVPSLPESIQETVYSVDYQGVRFIILNCLVEEEAQAAYLRKELERPGAKWTVLLSHYSIFSGRPGRQQYKSTEVWQPIIEEYGVDLVLQGHDHLYARGHVPVRTADGEFGDAFQTMYVTSVSGPKMYDISKETIDELSARGYRPDNQAEQKQFFQVIKVDGHQLSYTAYTADGEIFDQASITKDPLDGSKVLK